MTKVKMELFPIIYRICFCRIKKTCIFASHLRNGLVVQLVRMSACHAEGRGFESRPDRKNNKTP